jgi:hypothetical protein
MWVPNYAGKDMEIMIGFEFESEEEPAAPILFVQVVADTKTCKDFKNQFDHFIEEDQSFVCWFEAPLITFLPLADQKEQMVRWFIEHMGKMKEIIES